MALPDLDSETELLADVSLDSEGEAVTDVLSEISLVSDSLSLNVTVDELLPETENVMERSGVSVKELELRILMDAVNEELIDTVRVCVADFVDDFSREFDGEGERLNDSVAERW